MCAKYPQISTDYLLRGEGDPIIPFDLAMFKDKREVIDVLFEIRQHVDQFVEDKIKSMEIR